MPARPAQVAPASDWAGLAAGALDPRGGDGEGAACSRRKLPQPAAPVKSTFCPLSSWCAGAALPGYKPQPTLPKQGHGVAEDLPWQSNP